MPVPHFALAALMLLCAGSAASAAETEGVRWRSDLREAAAEAARDEKPLLLKFTATWCTYCHKMERTTFEDAKVAEHVNTCFVPVKIDADDEEELSQKLGVRGLPTTLLVTPQFEVLQNVAGYRTAPQLQEQLAKVCPLEESASDPPESLFADRETESAEPRAPAFGGHCLVTLRDGRKLVEGDPDVTATHHGIQVAFVDEAARAKFLADVEHYWPMWDGRCPVSAIEEGEAIEGEPITGAIFRGRLWFFADRERRTTFDERPTRYLPTSVAELPDTATTRQ